MKWLISLLSLVLAFSPMTQAQKREHMGQDRVESEEIHVYASRTELNRIVFPKPFINLMMQGAVPIENEFIPVSKNRGILFELIDDAITPFQLIAELNDGTVKNLRIVPDDRPGIIFRVSGAADRDIAEINNPTVTGHEDAVGLMKELLSTGNVTGFDPVALPSPIEYDKIFVRPVYASSDGYRRIFSYILEAKTMYPTQVAPPQFYVPGIEYILIDGDVVTKDESLIMYVVMDEQTYLGEI